MTARHPHTCPLIPIISRKWSLYGINKIVSDIYNKYIDLPSWPLPESDEEKSYKSYYQLPRDDRSFRSSKDQYPNGRFMVVIYITFNFEIIRIVRCIDYVNISMQLFGAYQIKCGDLRSIPVEMSQLGYPNADVASLKIILIEKPGETDWSLLSKPEQHYAFLSSVIIGARTHTIIQKNIQDASKLLISWLKEWDVEPDGLAMQAAKEEFEDLVKVQNSPVADEEQSQAKGEEEQSKANGGKEQSQAKGEEEQRSLDD